LKSQKNNQQLEEQAQVTKQPEQSEDNEFIDYDADFDDEYGGQTDEGIKVSSSDIEPVS
jgi:hypothetical protein